MPKKSRADNSAHQSKPPLLIRRERLLHELIALSRPTFLGTIDDEQAVARHFQTESDSKHTPAVNLLYETISQSLMPIAGDQPLDLRELERHLYYRHQVDDVPQFESLWLLEVILDATRAAHAWQVVDLGKRSRWLSALSAARDVSLLRRRQITTPSTFDDSARRIAPAVKALRAAGFSVQFNKAKPSMSDDERVRLATTLKQMISRIGAFEMTEALFVAIKGTYEASQDRYNIRRNSSAMRASDNDVPVGYLLNLVAATLTSPRVPKPSADEIVRVIELATNSIAILDIQLSLPHGVMSINHDSLIRVLRDLALSDSVRTFEQIPPSSASSLIEDLCARLPGTVLEPLELELHEVSSFTRVLFSALGQSPGPTVVSAATLRLAGLSGPELDRVLPYFVQPAGKINRDFMLPEDYEKSNAFRTPLIEFGQDYLSIEPRIAGSAFILAFIEMLRRADPNGFGRPLGYAIESVVRERFERAGLPVHFGAYSLLEQNGECDCVIETASTIYFIECKYREYHAESRVWDHHLFQDLRRVILEPIIQAGYHEIALRTVGSITLSAPNREPYTLRLRDRSIERIAVTLQEFGAVQSREIVERLLTLVAGAKWNSANPRVNTALTSLRKCSEQLLKQHQRLVELGARAKDDHMPHINCWSLTVNQLLTILTEVDERNPFDEIMEKTRHVRIGSLDEYYERARMRTPSDILRQMIDFGRNRRAAFIVA